MGPVNIPSPEGLSDISDRAGKKPQMHDKRAEKL